MEDRDWGAVEDFYASLIAGRAGLDALGLTLLEPPAAAAAAAPATSCELGCNATTGTADEQQLAAPEPEVCTQQQHRQQQDAPQQQQRQPGEARERAPPPDGRPRHRQKGDRANFKLLLSYLGPTFHGWQRQGGAGGSVEDAVQAGLAGVPRLPPVLAAVAAAAGRWQGVVLKVAGRTDRGVSAYAQVASFYTWDDSVTPAVVTAGVNSATPAALRCWHAERVPRSFHPTFQAHWRRYLYLFPLTRGCGARARGAACDGAGSAATGAACAEVDPAAVHALLQPLVGRSLDYSAFARDTPPGKDGTCLLLRARAWGASLPPPSPDAGCGVAPAAAPAAGAGEACGAAVMCVDLIATRFLKRMVRVLVATAVREAVPGAPWSLQCGSGGDQEHPTRLQQDARPDVSPSTDALLGLAATLDRRRTAPPAPAVGLCFLEAGFGGADVTAS